MATPAPPLRIAVVGCGALGTFYAARLARAGQDIHCLMRSDLDVARRDGLRIHSPDGDFQVRPRIAAHPAEIGPCDVVLIGLKTTANSAFSSLLPPLVDRSTAVVTLQNGLGNEAEIATLLGPEHVLGGLCFVCLNRVAPGVVVHSAHGRIVLGELNRPALPRTHVIANAFRAAGIHCDVTDDLETAHWEKLVWNIPFNGLGVAGVLGFERFSSGQDTPSAVHGPCLSTEDLLRDARWEQVVRELMLEVIAAANALGRPVPVEWAETQISRTRAMGAYRASTLVDFERGQPLELNSLFLEPLRQAAAAGVATPWLRRLCNALSRLDPGASALSPASPARGAT